MSSFSSEKKCTYRTRGANSGGGRFGRACREKRPRLIAFNSHQRSLDAGLDFIKARFALGGHLVIDGDNRDFIVVNRKWGQSRYCMDLDVLMAFGRAIGVLA